MSLYHDETLDPVWRAIAGHEGPFGPLDEAAVVALADLISAAGVAALVPAAADVVGQDAVQQARLLNRFRRLQGERWSAALNASGTFNMAMKGLASAHAVWPDPDGRAVSDADLLVAPADLDAALRFFLDRGFAFADMPTRGPWGFVGDASFQPLIGPDDGCNIDLHVQGDAHPFARALPAADLLGAAEKADVDGIWLPCASHRFLIAASHAAGDLFTADAIKSVVDGLLMLRDPDRIDFAELHSRCRAGSMTKPVTVFLALLARLGARVDHAAAAGFAIGSVRGRAFDQVVSAHRRCFAGVPKPGLLTRLNHEARLAAEPDILLRRNARRVFGMVRPRTGRPPIGVA
ncbi:nucleotidyltransferase family protein [Minwuia sp.]|uniref:nucleotidyltransferase family protein n=1 Tax=Minwuia sp. TaxID=2493630 RepID=UPI003A8EF13A